MRYSPTNSSLGVTRCQQAANQDWPFDRKCWLRQWARCLWPGEYWVYIQNNIPKLTIHSPARDEAVCFKRVLHTHPGSSPVPRLRGLGTGLTLLHVSSPVPRLHGLGMGLTLFHVSSPIPRLRGLGMGLRPSLLHVSSPVPRLRGLGTGLTLFHGASSERNVTSGLIYFPGLQNSYCISQPPPDNETHHH